MKEAPTCVQIKVTMRQTLVEHKIGIVTEVYINYINESRSSIYLSVMVYSELLYSIFSFSLFFLFLFLDDKSM